MSKRRRPDESSSPAVPKDLSDAVSLQSQRATRHLKKESAISTQLLVAGRAQGHSSSNACAREPTAAIQAINGGAVLPRITSHEQPGQL